MPQDSSPPPYRGPVDVVTPEKFGATSRGADPTSCAANALAIQAAINSFGANSGIVLLGHGYAIDRPIVVRGGVSLVGSGWGRSTIKSSPSSYLKWFGPAGDPMILCQASFGARIRSLRLIGNSRAKPSYAIQFDTDGGTKANDSSGADDIWIGHMFGLDSDQASQFERGLGMTGTINSDTNSFRHLVFWGVDQEAIDIPNRNAGATSFDTVRIAGCGKGIRCATSISITNIFCHTKEHNFILETGGKIYIWNFASEGSGGLLLVNGDSTKFVLRDGAWQAQNGDVFADGRILDVGSNTQWHIDLENFTIQHNGGATDPPAVKMRLYNAGGGITNGYFRCVGCQNIWPNNLELGALIDYNDNRTIILETPQYVPLDHPLMTRVQCDYSRVEDRSYQQRNDFSSKLNNYGGPFNVRRLVAQPAPIVTALLGSGSTPYSYRISSLTYDGETTLSAAGSVANAAMLGPGVASNKISWRALPGAIGYKIYGRGDGAELLLATVTWDDLHGPNGSLDIVTPPSWVDDGSAAPAGAQPTKNTTGNAVIEGQLTLANSGGANGWRTPAYLGTSALWVDSAGKLRIKGGTPESDMDGMVVGAQS
jgi:hypothetical protein